MTRGGERTADGLARTAAASLIGVAIATPVYLWLCGLLSGIDPWNIDGITGVPLLAMSKLEVLVVLAVGSIVGLLGFVAAGVALRIPDLRRLIRR